MESKSEAAAGSGPTSSAVAPKRQAGFLFILVTLLIDIMGIGLIIPVLPKLVTQLSGGIESESATIYGVFVAVYAGMQFLFAPLLGALSDRFGRRPVLLISIFGTACDYVFMTFAPTLGLLFVGRLLNGLTAANISTCNAYIADVSKPEERAKRFGMVGAVFGVGFVLGPLMGGILGQSHLRWPFAFAAVLAFINFMYGWLVLPESHKVENRSAFKWSKANPLGTLVVLRQFPGVAPLAVVLVLLNLAQYMLHAVWVLYTGYRFGWGPRDVGLSLMFVGVMAVIVQGGLTGKVVKRVGEYQALYIGLVAAAAAYFLYGVVTRGWMMYASIVVGAFGGLIMPAAQALMTKRVGPKNQGVAQGAFSSMYGLAAVAAPLLATGLFSRFSGPKAVAEIPGMPFLVGAALSVASLIVALTVLRKPVEPGAADLERVGGGQSTAVPAEGAVTASASGEA